MKRSKDEEPTTFSYDPDFFTARDIRTVDLARVAALFGPDIENVMAVDTLTVNNDPKRREATLSQC